MLPPNNRKGSGFTNINRVVTANQGNQLGQTVSSGVQNQANQVKQQTQQATTSFNDEAQKKRLDTDEAANDRDAVIGRYSGANTNTTQSTQPKAQMSAPSSGVANVDPGYNLNQNNTQQPAAAPQAVQGPSDQEVSNFARYRTGTYEGPNQLQDYQSLAGKAQNTEMLGDLSRSSGGRQELLKRFVGGSGYTQGQQGLDNVLLGQSGNALNQTRRATQGLTQDVAGANTQAASLAEEYKNRAKIFGTETVNKLTGAREPISTKVDEQLKANQGNESKLNQNFTALQGILDGSDPNYKNMDRITRLGLGLQSAKDAGFLNDTQVNQLLGDGGLIQRAEQLGLDTNALVNERLSQIKGQNLTRGGAATADQEAQLNAFDKLMGKQGTDVEFARGTDDYIKGQNQFNFDSLNDYLGTKEREKYANDAAKLADQEAYNQRYVNQGMSGVKQQLGGATQLGGAALNQVLNPQSFYNPGEVGQNINQGVQGATNMAAGGIHAADNMGNSLVEGITKLNIGGQSLANTEGGRQLLKALELKNKMVNSTTDMASGAVNSVGQGWQDLLSGNIDDGLMGVTGITGAKQVLGDLNDNIAREIAGTGVGRALGDAGRSIGNVATNVGNSVSNAVSNITGGGIKISDEDLKTNIDYDKKHIDDFLSKLKPALYDYKDEVKDSPLASNERQFGVMAQDLEKSDMGKESVIDTEGGKVVDYDDLQPKMLAALATLKADIDELKKKKK